MGNFIKRVQPERWISIALVVVVLCVFGRVAGHEFIDYDDNAYILHNSHVRTGLTPDNVRWAFGSMEMANWHPLTWLSHMLDCQIFGLHPAGHHLTSVFFHLANTLLLFLILRLSTGLMWESAVVAALFGLHPVHIESVAWIAERKDVLSAFFGMLSLLAYIRYVQKPAVFRYLMVGMSFGFGLMTKPMVVTLPFVMLLYDFWPIGRMKPFRRSKKRLVLLSSASFSNTPRPLSYLVLEKLPFFILSAGSCVVTYIAQLSSETVSPLETLSLSTRILNGFVAYVQYLFKMIWPQNLAILYPHPLDAIPLWQGGVAAVLIVGLTLVFVYLRFRLPFLLMGWLWYLGTLIPVIGIVQVGAQAMADRYTYFPAIGVFIAVVWTFSRLRSTFPILKSSIEVAAFLLVICLSVTTWFQLGRWQNTETLFDHTLSVTQRNPIAYFILGNAYLEENRFESAAVAYRKALEIHPRYTDALNNLGLVLAKQGFIQEAVITYEKALNTHPNHILSLLNLADALVALGRLDDAILYYNRVLSIDHDKGAAHNAIGVALARSGKMKEAIAHLSRAVALCQDCPEPLNNLGRVLTLTGDLHSAIVRFQQAISLKPDFAEAYNNLGLVFLKLNAFKEAADCFSAALNVEPDYEKARENLKQVPGLH